MARMSESHKYNYVIKSSAESCPWGWPRVRLVPYVKCCTTLRKTTQSITYALKMYDVIIVTGDEYCAVKDKRVHYRQYYGTGMMGNGASPPFIKYPLLTSSSESDEPTSGEKFSYFLPLGPRSEFGKVAKTDVVQPSNTRKYVYNFLGSTTSYSRKKLRTILFNDLKTGQPEEKFPSFVHVTDKWHVKITKDSGYVDPAQYRKVLFNSQFTLCPIGHNPEAYRIYEACEAGSIPILSLDRYYGRHECKDAYAPFVDAGAPFVFLKGGWPQLEKFLNTKASNATWVSERQVAVRSWYREWMKSTALRFEDVMEWRHAKRMARGESSVTALDKAQEHEEEIDETLELEQGELDQAREEIDDDDNEA